jgi:hypothetical protein
MKPLQSHPIANKITNRLNNSKKGRKSNHKALFGCMCIQFNPQVVEWIGMELSLIPLSTRMD